MSSSFWMNRVPSSLNQSEWAPQGSCVVPRLMSPVASFVLQAGVEDQRDFVVTHATFSGLRPVCGVSPKAGAPSPACASPEPTDFKWRFQQHWLRGVLVQAVDDPRPTPPNRRREQQTADHDAGVGQVEHPGPARLPRSL
jgi:hypothetical protein